MGLFKWMAARRAEEAGVSEAEDPAVGGDQPVAVAVRGGGDPHDGLVEDDVAGRAEEAGGTEVEHPAIGGDQRVPGAP